jgi:transcriptional regulator with XRE-family HTH domain
VPPRPRRPRARPGTTQADTTLARLRIEAGAAQAEVARAAGLSLSTYRRLESGEYYGDDPPLSALVNVAITLGADPLLLLSEYLHWHDLGSPEPPAPGSVAPGVPPEEPPRESHEGAEQPGLSSSQRDLLRELLTVEARVDGDLQIRILDADTDSLTVAFEGANEPRRQRPRRIRIAREDLAALSARGYLTVASFSISAAGRVYAEQHLRRGR